MTTSGAGGVVDVTMIQTRLLRVRRRLGPYLSPPRSEPYAQNDAEIARCLVEALDVLDALVVALSDRR